MSVGVTAEVKSKLSVVDVVGETGHAQEGGHHLQGPLPLPRREDAVVRGHPGARVLALLRLRPGRRHLQLRHAARRRDVPGGAPHAGREAGVEIDERTKREDARKARLRQVLDTAIAFYHAVLTGSKAGEPALAYLRGSRLHRRDDRDPPARLGAGRLGPDGPPAPGQARHPPRGARRGRARQPEPAAAAASSTSSGPASSSRSATRTATRSGSAAGCWKGRGPSTSTPRRRRCSTRAGRSTSSTRPRARSASRTRPSSSRATPTR